MNNKRYWLRIGITLTVIHFIFWLTIFIAALNSMNVVDGESRGLVLIFLIFVDFVATLLQQMFHILNNHSIVAWGLLFLIIGSIRWFVIGSICGWIYGKIIHRNKNNSI